MPIPFIRSYPGNKGAIQEITRSHDIEVTAREFLARGGWYVAKIVEDGNVLLMATDINLEPLVVIKTRNDSSIMQAVDKLVKESHANISKDMKLKFN